jgi:tetratricopeptide (TPR) repeat protein
MSAGLKYLLLTFFFFLRFTQLDAQKTANDYFNIGNARMIREEYASAADAFSKAIALNPDFTEAYFNRGLCYLKTRKQKKAVDDFVEVIRLEHDETRGYVYLAKAKTELGDFKGALLITEYALISAPKSSAINFQRGEAEFNLGNFQAALNNYDCAIEFDANMHDAWYKKGITNYMLGKKSEACENLRTAISLGNKEAFNVLRIYCR